MRGERAVEEAESAVFPSEVPVTAAPQTTINGNPYASGTGERPQLPLATMTAEDNPNATGGASVLGVRMKEEGVFAVIVAVMVLF